MYAVVFLLYVFQFEALFMQASVGYRLDDSASDLFTGVAGRLTGKIICHTVNDHRSSEDGIDEEPFVIKHLICIALIAQKRGKVSGMLRMGHVVGIVMISGLVKRYAAVPVFMNMHTVEIAGTLYMDIGKPEDFGFYKDSAVRGLIKFYRSCKLGLGSIPLDPCDSGRRRMGQEILKMRSRCRLIHGYLTNSFLSSICRKVPVSYSVTGAPCEVKVACMVISGGKAGNIKYNQVCPSFVKEQCRRLDRAPCVCNGCGKPLSRCTVPHKYIYNARFAHCKYEELRSSSGQGANLSRHEALQIKQVAPKDEKC